MTNVLPRKAKHGVTNNIDLGLDTIDELTVTRVSAAKIGDGDTDATKLEGLYSTRNNANTSMYIPVAATSGYERGWKIAYAPQSNTGGYFDALFVNTKVTSTYTPSGELRAIEAKCTIEGDGASGAIATGLYAKVNVSGSTAEIAKAIGVDVLLEEESSGTITEGIGVRVQGGAGQISKGIEVNGVYDVGAIDIPYVDGNAAVSIAALESAFGTDNAKQGIIGIYQDNADLCHLVLGNSKTGKYQTQQFTPCAA